MLKYFNTIKLSISSNLLVLIIPLLFFVLPFIGSKVSKKNEFNEDYLGLAQTKVIRGFLAVGIILHHLAQTTAASWLETRYIIHGLDFFVDIGYIFVGSFLFFSGYGLYISHKTKNDYYEHFVLKRIVPIFVAYLTTSLVYYLYKGIDSTYTWYVIAIIVCYFAFYLTFRNNKNEIISILIITLVLFVYMIVCNFLMLGGWWYNVIFMFVVGILYARHERIIVKFLKRFHLPLLIISIILTVVFRYYGHYYESAVYSVRKENLYDLYSFYIILFRFLASFSFTLSVLLISLKVKFKNIVLDLYGKISLELYLIQGLFVQSFAYCYFIKDVKPLYYIKNIPLYILVVLVLSTIAGFALNYVDKKIMDFLIYFSEKRKQEIKYVAKSLKVVFIVIVLACVLYVLSFSVISVIQSKNDQKYIDNYVDKYITYTEVNGKKMAAYVVGEGKDTLVFMRGNDDPCPTMSMRRTADKLAEKYRVIVLDYLGTGFSDKSETERTSKNIAYEIHEALHNLDIDGKYILVPEYISGLYAQEYVKKYKNEVKGVIAVESFVSPLLDELANYSGVSKIEYQKHRSYQEFCVRKAFLC